MTLCKLCEVNNVSYRKLKLCRFCFKKEKAQGNLPKKVRKPKDYKEEDEWTEEELNTLIYQQMQCLPSWWKGEVAFSEDDV